MKTFVDRLKEAVELRERETGEKIQKKQLAAAAGVTSSAVTLWYKGTTANVKADAMFRLARFLRVRVEWLKYGRGSIKPDGAEPALFDAEPEELAPSADVYLSPEGTSLVRKIIVVDRDKKLAREVLKALNALIDSMLDDFHEATSATDAVLARAVAEARKLPGNKPPAKKSRRKQPV